MLTALLTGRDPKTLLPDGSDLPGQAMTGTVHLTMPLSAWAGWTDAPGEIAGLGPADADTCRDLAARLAASTATRWCLTLTDPNGVAAGHACAARGPGRGPGKDPPESG